MKKYESKPIMKHESRIMKKPSLMPFCQLDENELFLLIHLGESVKGMLVKHMLTLVVNVLKISLDIAICLYLFHECIANYARHVKM